MREIKYKLVPVEATQAMVDATGYDTNEDHIDYEIKSTYTAMVAAAPQQLSDLEIVWKALHKEELHLITYYAGDWSIRTKRCELIRSGSGWVELLTWAKQTIGVE